MVRCVVSVMRGGECGEVCGEVCGECGEVVVCGEVCGECDEGR